MPTIKPDIKNNTQKVELTPGDRKAFETIAATFDWLSQHDKNAAAKDGAINIRAVLKHYEKPAKAPKSTT